jgi:hypothetical protein
VREQRTGISLVGAIALAALLCALCFSLAGCDLYEYGRLGGADKTASYYPPHPSESVPGKTTFEAVMDELSGVWYSHWAGIGRLDGYRIGKWEDFERLVVDSKKTDLFPKFDSLNPETYGGESPKDGDYFVLYDDTVYGEQANGSGGNGGWEGFSTRYIGIVRAVNLFYDIRERGAIIIEYLKGCAPQWLNRWPESSNGRLPFFGIYYRVLDSDTVQMANAVDLEALYKGQQYYTEKATLPEAVESNGVENEAEYIAWGVVIPQDREK